MATEHELIGSKGCGSAVIELALALAGVPYSVTDLPYLEPGLGRDRLLGLNPLGQVPTLVLPDGQVMTESAAMILHIADLRPESRLVPLPQDPERPAFLNLLIVLVAAIYPTFTIGDQPQAYTLPGEASEALRAATEARKADIWSSVEARIEPAPFVFGERISAIDLYLSVMRWWRPGRAWFAANCPKITCAADAVAARPDAARILERHFG